MQAIELQSIPQAIILEGGLELCTHEVMRLLSTWVCACKNCNHCQLIANQEHPDIYWLKPQAGHGIKIEQIREVLNTVAQTPCLLDFQIVVIEAADTMNLFAANALLKTVEEPSSKLHFIFLVNSAKLLPQTLRSRCWQISLEAPNPKFKLEDMQILQQDILAYLQAKMDLSSLLKKYEDRGVDEWCQQLQWLTYDFMKQRLGGQGQLKYDIVFQVSLPLSIWWAFWEKLGDCRFVYRNQTSLNRNLLLSDLLLILQGAGATT